MRVAAGTAAEPQPLAHGRAAEMGARRLQNVFGNVPTVPGTPVEQQRATEAAAQFAPAQQALRATPRLVVASVLIYMGAALVIGSQPAPLTRDLAALSDRNLCEWSVVNGSALASSFAAFVARGVPARQAALLADPWWLVAPTVDASFTAVHNQAVNSRRGCPPGSTVKYLVTFPSIAASVFYFMPTMCERVQAVSLEGQIPAATFNMGLVFTAAGHNGALADDPAAAGRLRRMVAELNRRLLLELRSPTVTRYGLGTVPSACPSTVGLVGLEHLLLPAMLWGLPLAVAVVLALVVPLLLAAASRADRPGGTPHQEGDPPDGETAIALPAFPPLAPADEPAGGTGRGEGDPAEAPDGCTA